ncbi:hypothetical protein [Allocoleopsis franciscana]|uniref:Uncharacterized protein n=1 Tax=Allocoleopsis franciscana PCC 7113 TaxID=1173027 RepID=K9WA55_9CYAN|nr:hypothetical protein [Allocoleopsis franciscana]AFZ16696.1 hypothetical protein Mic7113_0787 [Allocoleopsis franciscana PCC 7113]
MVKLFSHPSDRPWAIARILPNAKTYIVVRFRNRQDAEDHKRFLRRFIPKAQFEVLFDIPKEEVEENQSELLQET